MENQDKELERSTAKHLDFTNVNGTHTEAVCQNIDNERTFDENTDKKPIIEQGEQTPEDYDNIAERRVDKLITEEVKKSDATNLDSNVDKVDENHEKTSVQESHEEDYLARQCESNETVSHQIDSKDSLDLNKDNPTTVEKIDDALKLEHNGCSKDEKTDNSYDVSGEYQEREVTTTEDFENNSNNFITEVIVNAIAGIIDNVAVSVSEEKIIQWEDPKKNDTSNHMNLDNDGNDKKNDTLITDRGSEMNEETNHDQQNNDVDDKNDITEKDFSHKPTIEPSQDAHIHDVENVDSNLIKNKDNLEDIPQTDLGIEMSSIQDNVSQEKKSGKRD